MNIENKIKKQFDLAQFTTFKIGGAAKHYLEVKTKEELEEAFLWAEKEDEKVFILGGGSNILIPDNGIDGLVLRMTNDNFKIMGERFECGAGVGLNQIITKCTGHSLSGLEWASGIPRVTVGGAICGNAGAFGRSMLDTVETVDVFDIKKRIFRIFSKRDCKFEYRNSIFKKDLDLLIWGAILKMQKEDLTVIKGNIEKSINFRTKCYPRLPSAGSVFENLDQDYVRKQSPILFEKELKDKIGRTGKIAAGLIIDMCDLKGKTMGGIKISLEHANHIVNTGKGRAEEVIMLISYIKQQVRDKFNIELKEEIQYFGS
ncbi:MAG: UDP-N-acetylmuramate dehydrogenase [Patescibacteria group bacterium]|nr:UDP-N-acetylmuramate dehydrogenase [Patescibacteria group bacterium]